MENIEPLATEHTEKAVTKIVEALDGFSYQQAKSLLENIIEYTLPNQSRIKSKSGCKSI